MLLNPTAPTQNSYFYNVFGPSKAWTLLNPISAWLARNNYFYDAFGPSNVFGAQCTRIGTAAGSYPRLYPCVAALGSDAGRYTTMGATAHEGGGHEPRGGPLREGAGGRWGHL